MIDKTNHLYLDSHERKLLIHSLVELKNQRNPKITPRLPKKTKAI